MDKSLDDEINKAIFLKLTSEQLMHLKGWCEGLGLSFEVIAEAKRRIILDETPGFWVRNLCICFVRIGGFNADKYHKFESEIGKVRDGLGYPKPFAISSADLHLRIENKHLYSSFDDIDIAEAETIPAFLSDTHCY